MSSSPDSLRFTLSTYGDSMLCKMNVLREEHRFCDIQLILGGTNDSTTQPLRFHGHRVVLAASSEFLRDQFLLHEGQAELSVRVVSSARVAQTLLLSCYSGFLEIPLRELVRYLTAASALQMSPVVEKCTQTLFQYLHPDPCLKLQRSSGGEGNQQLYENWPSPSFTNQRGNDAVQLSTSIQESNTKDGAALTQLSQEAEADCQAPREIREDRKLEKAKMKLSEDEAFKLHTLDSEETSDTNNPSFHLHSVASFKWKPHCPADIQHLISSENRSSAACKELMDFKKQHEQTGDQAEEDVYTQAAQLRDKELMEPKLCGQSGRHLVKMNLTAEDSDSVAVQRPYLCRRCDKIFQHLQSYMGHLKLHRQFPCLVCGESFSQRSSLTRHIHVHVGVKPFRCPLCHKTFPQKALLQEHLHLHTEKLVSYVCSASSPHARARTPTE